jgi:hypothetical protein
MDFNFIGGSYRARSAAFDAQRTINLYPEVSQSGTSKNIAYLVGSPGTVLFATLAGGGIRGCIRFSATLSIVVAGGNVYSVTTAGVGTLIGTIVNRATPVSMAQNGSTIMLVTGFSEGYFITPLASTVTAIADPDFIGADRVDFIDGYFVFNRLGTSRFQITSILGTDIDPLDFASAEGSPDLLVSLIVDQRDAWLFGENSTEVFFNSGAPDFPFERIQGAFIEVGCIAKNSPAKSTEGHAWLGADDRGQGICYRNNGYSAQRISTHAEEYAWAQYSRIDDAVGYTYQMEGHTFYVLTFPTGNATWVYDYTTQLWHERAWRNPADASLNRHRGNCMVAFGGKIIIGDWEVAKLYYFSLDTYTDNGDPLPAIRIAPRIFNPSGGYVFFNELSVDIEFGVGTGVVGLGFDPDLAIDWSNDGGLSFQNERTVKMGAIGQSRRRRARYRRLGKDFERTYRVTCTAPVKRIFINADSDHVMVA